MTRWLPDGGLSSERVVSEYACLNSVVLGVVFGKLADVAKDAQVYPVDDCV